MAESQPASQPQTAKSKKSGPASPGLQVFGGVVLNLLALVCFAFANVLRTNTDAFEPEARAIIITSLVVGGVVLVSLGLASLVTGAVRSALRYNVGSSEGDAMTGKTEQLLESINRHVSLSETAKRIAYRHHDLAALRETIRDDIRKGEYDAAVVLVEEMSRTYGYLEESENFRDQIASARRAETEAKISGAMTSLDDVLRRHDFMNAQREAAKLQRLYPDSDRVRSLPGRVREAREQYKVEMEREFLAAAEREDIDRAMELMKELDKYLTEAEAEPFREVARGVIGKKRENLGVQFKMAVHDRDWTRSVRVGEQIIAEFPNTRMADEVRDRLDLLRARAADQRAAQVAV